MGNNHKPNRPQTKEPRRYYGYIVSFFEEKNFGFVRTADNEDFFFHAGAAMGFTPAPGIKVIFTLSNKKPAPGNEDTPGEGEQTTITYPAKGTKAGSLYGRRI